MGLIQGILMGIGFVLGIILGLAILWGLYHLFACTELPGTGAVNCAFGIHFGG